MLRMFSLFCRALFCLTLFSLLFMSSKSVRLLEVGIMVGSVEFYHVFGVSYGAVMKTYNSKALKLQSISFEDWLVLDFPTLLATRLNVSPKKVCCHYVRPFNVDRNNPVTVTYGSSSPFCWVDAFVNDIASYYAQSL